MKYLHIAHSAYRFAINVTKLSPPRIKYYVIFEYGLTLPKMCAKVWVKTAGTVLRTHAARLGIYLKAEDFFMLRLRKIDPTNGPIASSVIKYAFPVFLTSLIQTFMSAADTAVLGNMADSAAVASVGATSTVVALLVTSMLGISEGAKILMARTIGAGDFERCKRIVSTAIITAFCMGIAVAISGIFLSRPILELLECPSDCIDGAVMYLSIYFVSTPFTLIYNFSSGIIAISGDSARPMEYMIISGISNIALNVIMCLILPNKVVAVAIATVVGTAISTALAMRDVINNDKFAFDIKRMTFNINELLLMLKYGIPITLSTAIYPISNLQIQTVINSYGSSSIAGNTAAIYVEGVAAALNSAAGSATATFVGQNLGANKPGRIKRSMLICTALAVCCSLPLTQALYALGKPMLSIFVPNDEAAITYGMIRMSYTVFFYFIPSITACVTSAINAFGYTFIPPISSFFSVFVFRSIWMKYVYQLNPTYNILCLCFTVSWILHLLFCASALFMIYFLKLRKNMLKSI